MLLFSTILPINETLTKDAFIELAIKWNQGGHPDNLIHDIVWDGSRNVRFGDDKMWMQIEEYRNQNIIAIRYEKTEEDGVVWDTDYVMNFNEMKMSVRLDRSYLEEAMTIYSSFYTPAFIALLIDGGYVSDDNGLAIGRKPVFIKEDSLSLITDVINGNTKYGFPVVFISKTFAGSDPVDIWEVAKRLKGVAHVLVQESPRIGGALRQICDDKNEYNGAIGIYFPNPAAGHVKILNHIYDGSDKIIEEKVVRRVMQYSNSQRTDVLYTWPGVNNALLRDKYTSKREELEESESARQLSEARARIRAFETAIQLEDADQKVKRAEAFAQECQDLVDSVDEEIEQMKRQIETLTRQNDALNNENTWLRAQLNAKGSVPILYLGSEEELFPGEIKEFILEILDKELQNSIKPKTRRADVIGDIIRSNGGVTGLPTEKADQVKKLLFGYKAMTSPVRSALKELGFEIIEGGSHYKLVYYGDGRYWTTIDTTPGDGVRGGRNAALEIIRDML